MYFTIHFYHDEIKKFILKPVIAEYDATPAIEENCSCYHACEEDNYDVSVTSASFPSERQMEQLFKSYPNLKPDLVKYDDIILAFV